jgi:choice-of-anchor B domain-containing protein
VRIIALVSFLIMLPLLIDATPHPCIDGKSANKYECQGVTLQAQVALNRFAGKPRTGSNLWGYVDPDDQREYAIVGLRNGVSIVDVTIPNRPRIVGHVAGSISPWREAKVYSFQNKSTKKWDAYAYVSTLGLSFNGEILIVDLSELPNRIRLAAKLPYSAHTLFISNVDFATGKKLSNRKPRLYLNGTLSGMLIFELTDPVNPKLLGAYNSYVADCYTETFTGSSAGACKPGHNPCEVYFGWDGQQFFIMDVTDPKSIQILSSFKYPGIGYAHSGWISKDKKYMFNFDEYDVIQNNTNTRILTFDISNLLNPTVAATFFGKTRSINHNGIVVGSKLYLAHYTRGLVVMDVTNPKAIREIAYFDTHPQNNVPQHHGAWGVYPFLRSGNILIGDIERGLFILKEE